jgi:hypothetical protein
MGMQRPPGNNTTNVGLRNRIWWVMVARDNRKCERIVLLCEFN